MTAIRDAKRLPWRRVRHLCLVNGAWVVGSGALEDMDPKKLRDIDLLITPDRWREVAALVSTWQDGQVGLTTFGGFRLSDVSTEDRDAVIMVDVFTETLEAHLERGRCRAAWHPLTGVRFHKIEGGS